MATSRSSSALPWQLAGVHIPPPEVLHTARGDQRHLVRREPVAPQSEVIRVASCGIVHAAQPEILWVPLLCNAAGTQQL